MERVAYILEAEEEDAAVKCEAKSTDRNENAENIAKRRRQDRVRQLWLIRFLRGQQSKRVRIPKIKAVEKSRLWDLSVE